MENQAKKSLCVISNLPVNLKREMIKTALNNGQFFTVTWKKKDGIIATMNARFGVVKHLKNTGKVYSNGSTNTVAHIPKYLTVYKTKKGYRNLDLDTVITLKTGGNIIHFSG